MNLHTLGELKQELPQMEVGDRVKVTEKIESGEKTKPQVFEGILISKKHGNNINATFTVRTILNGVGVEKTYPLHAPWIKDIEVVKKGRSRRSKIYYIRGKPEKEVRKKLKPKK